MEIEYTSYVCMYAYSSTGAVLEPMVIMTRRAAGGDIKVIKSGTSWILDVGIICPGSQRLVSKGTDICRHNPRQGGSPLRRQEDEDVQRPGELRAFIVETGGRINAAGLQFLSRILSLEAEHGWTNAEAWTC